MTVQLARDKRVNHAPRH